MSRTRLAPAFLTGLALLALAGAAAGPVRGGDSFVVLPGSAVLLAGETLQLTVSAEATEPLAWSSTDSNVCHVSMQGLLEAVAPGRCRVMVEDSLGLVAVSDVFTVAHFELCAQSVTVDNSPATFAVRISGDLESHQFSAFEFTLGIDTLVCVPVGARSTGTLSESWGEPACGLAPDRVRVAHAGSTPLTGSGVLVEVLLSLRQGLADGTSGPLTLDDIVIDEDQILARGCGGTVTVSGEPIVVESVSVEPASVSLGPNAWQVFTAQVVSNGDGDVLWSVAGGADYGTITADGVYRSPAVPPVSGHATVVATSVDDPTVSDIAQVDLQQSEESGLLQLAVQKNPALPRSLQIWVSAATAFLASPQVDVAGDPVVMTAVNEESTAYLGQVLLPVGTHSVTISASGSTAAGNGEAVLDVSF
jgi:hypothetical protein